jgi:hypothetical protein
MTGLKNSLTVGLLYVKMGYPASILARNASFL